MIAMTQIGPRAVSFERTTGETRIRGELDLNGPAGARVDTGLPFLDHMLAALALFAGLRLELEARGDLAVDDHHTVEDVALAFGEALRATAGDRRGLARFGWALVPLDEALARVALDLSGRPFARVALGLVRERIGTVSTENLSHFLRSFAAAGALTLHAEVLAGDNDHHRCEAAFKALGLALGQALAPGVAADRVPSTKGVLA